MKKQGNALVFIVLGLIVLGFPLLGVITLGALSGFIVLALGIGLLIAGIGEMDESKTMGILELILGFVALILGIGFTFNPALFSGVVGFLVLISGLSLIITGIMTFITQKGDNQQTGIAKRIGVVVIILGILYLVFGYVISNPLVLGVLIGLWLLIKGAILLLVKTD